MEEILKQILTELKDLKQGQNNISDKVDSLEIKINSRFNKLEAKVDIANEQIATLTEFKTETTQKLTAIDGGKK